MTELVRFLFDGLPVRGQLVRLDDAWQEVLRRRAANTQTGPYPRVAADFLGEMTAAAVLMQASIRFDGALVLQIFGDGPLRLVVVEVQSDLRLRATVLLTDPVRADATLTELVNVGGGGSCAITLDPGRQRAHQQAYQGVVSLVDDAGAPLGGVAQVIEQYMRRSEQLDTVLMLAANESVAAGLLLQRLPQQGQHNLAQTHVADESADVFSADEDDFRRLAILAQSLKRKELLELDSETILRRLFWDERVLRLVPEPENAHPRFACSCSRERVSAMLTGLGQDEVESIIHEQGQVEVGCDFCGQQERYDAVDVARLFTPAEQQSPLPPAVH